MHFLCTIQELTFREKQSRIALEGKPKMTKWGGSPIGRWDLSEKLILLGLYTARVQGPSRWRIKMS
jgi:hypothetical protein